MEIETKLILNIWTLFLANKYVNRYFDLIIKRIREICQIPSESGQKLLVYFGILFCFFIRNQQTLWLPR